MPIKIPDGMPAASVLEKENIFIMSETRAVTQDIRPLKIVIMNLMPTKVETEIQLMRLLSNTPLQIDITLLVPATHESKNISKVYLERFYKTFEDIKNDNFDGIIFTGAPLEDLEFEDVDYWPELCEIMDWSRIHATTSVYICWASLAGLYYHYGINKISLPKKKAGIFEYRNMMEDDPLMRGIDQILRIPQSRYATVSADDIARCPRLSIAALDSERDPGIIISDDNMVFITGHMEYDTNTLANEYQRDVDKGIEPAFPLNYYPDDDPRFDPILSWRSYSTLFFTNWLNYYVYQLTPYDLNKLNQTRQ